MKSTSIVIKIKNIVVFLIVLMPSLVFSREYGVNVYYSTFSLDDQNGPTEKVSQFSPLNFFYADKLSFDSRYWTEMSYDSVVLAAGGNDVGQQVSVYGFNGAWQKRFRVSTEIKPWVGLGLSYAMVDTKKRHTIDDDGFLNQRYDDQRVNNVDLYFVASNHWKLNQQWDIGAVTRVVPPLIGDVFLFSVGISANYH